MCVRRCVRHQHNNDREDLIKQNGPNSGPCGTPYSTQAKDDYYTSSYTDPS